MEEFIFFSLEGIKVSNIQFIADGFTYALQDVIAVEHGMTEPSRVFATFCVLAGAFLFIFEDIFMFAGGFAIALGMVAWLSAKTRYSVVIHTSTGQHQALTSENSHDIDRVIRALNTAIIHRD
ncbi:DUF6232 family protein [Methylophilus flavus]|jgi:hypothetical protein|uniref:DUF6232 family protein n=1 Tax=Methylophilus flavus TaxID=640084 RepID=A0ABW3PF92_9PROT